MGALENPKTLVKELLPRGGNFKDGALVELSPNAVYWYQLPEGAWCVDSSNQVFVIRYDMAEKLHAVLKVSQPQTRFMCGDGGFGPDTGRPIL